jgi:hypothetical protein
MRWPPIDRRKGKLSWPAPVGGRSHDIPAPHVSSRRSDAAAFPITGRWRGRFTPGEIVSAADEHQQVAVPTPWRCGARTANGGRARWREVPPPSM